MAQVLIVGRKRDSLEVVRALQDVGVVQIDPLDSSELERNVLVGPEAERRASLERQLARVESILAAVGHPHLAPAPTRLRTIPDLGPFLEEVGHRSDVLVKERSELESELALTGAYRGVARALADLIGDLDRSERLAVVSFTADDAEDLNRLRAVLEETLAGRYALGYRNAGTITAGAVAVRRQDEAAARAALGRAGLAEFRLAGRFAGLPLRGAAGLVEERGRTGPEELVGVREGLAAIAREHGPTLIAARNELRDELARYAAIESGARGRYGFALRGWLPVANKSALESALSPLKNQVLYQFEDPDPHHPHHVPVKLDNNPVVKPFELLMGIFAPPGYGTFDPTWVLALFFPIFFGFVIGDIGFGLVFLLLAFLLRNMAGAGRALDLGVLGVVIPPKPLKSLSTIMFWLSGWSIFFGFLYGELFGTLGEHLGWFHIPGHAAEGGEHAASGLGILLPRVEPSFANTMLLLALAPGIFQILYGWFVRFRIGLAHGDRRHTFEGLGMFLGLVGLIIIAYKFRNEGAPSSLYLIGGAFLVAYLVCVVLSGVFMMLVEILSNGGNILSYLRLYAVGLSSALLANLATDLGWNLGASLGVAGILIGIIVAVIVHVLAIALTIIGHVLQPLRLHYAEFFTKFGFFDHSGRPYRPFARVAGTDTVAR